jgi:hypothetical protein
MADDNMVDDADAACKSDGFEEFEAEIASPMKQFSGLELISVVRYAAFWQIKRYWYSLLPGSLIYHSICMVTEHHRGNFVLHPTILVGKSHNLETRAPIVNRRLVFNNN